VCWCREGAGHPPTKHTIQAHPGGVGGGARRAPPGPPPPPPHPRPGGVVCRLLLRGLLSPGRFARRQHHAHVATFLERLGLDHGEPVEVLEEAFEQCPPPLRMGLLAAAEHDRDLHLVLVAQEAHDVALLRLVVVVGDLRPQLDLAHVDLLLVLAGGLLLLLLLVLVLRVVEQAGDRGFRVGRHLDQVEVRLLGSLQRLGRLDDAELLAVGADQTHLGDADPLVDPSRVALWWAPIEPARDRHYLGLR